jgi:hypothetical protein
MSKNAIPENTMSKNREFVDSSNKHEGIQKNPTNPKKYDERRNHLDILNDLDRAEINRELDKLDKLNILDKSYDLDYEEKIKKTIHDGTVSKLSSAEKDPSPKYESDNSNFFSGNGNLKSVEQNVEPLFPESSWDEMIRQAHPLNNDLDNPTTINQQLDTSNKLNTKKKIMDNGYVSKLPSADKDPRPKYESKYESENSNFLVVKKI